MNSYKLLVKYKKIDTFECLSASLHLRDDWEDRQIQDIYHSGSQKSLSRDRNRSEIQTLRGF